MGRERFPAIRRKTEPEYFARLIREAALFQIPPGVARLGGVALELIFPPGQSPLVELDHLIALSLARLEAAVVDHLRQRDAGFLGHDTDSFGKGDAFDLHDEVENRAAFLTAEAIKNFFGRVD